MEKSIEMQKDCFADKAPSGNFRNISEEGQMSIMSINFNCNNHINQEGRLILESRP